MNVELARSWERGPERPRVLVVDDDHHVVDMLARFLERSGFDVTTASDGVKALQAVAQGFDVITTDLDMPRMNGHEFIQRLRDLPISPIPVVVVSGQRPGEAVAERVHSCLVITKPVRLGELARTLRSLLTACHHDRFSCETCSVSAREAPA
jgi:chemosensory pili system protein ChpA (sensor histidine kinase/response regulator)